MLGFILSRYVRVRRWQPRPGLQQKLQPRVRTSIPGARDHFRLSHMVCSLPSLGDGQLSPIILSHAAKVEEELYSMDIRRLAEPVPFLVHRCRIYNRLPNPIYPDHQPRSVQTHWDLMGMGDCIYRSPAVLPRR